MCDAVMAAQVAQGLLGAAGTGVQVYGDVKEGGYRQRESLAQGALADAGAADAQARGNRAAGQLRLEASQLGAQQKVAYAASGVDATTGTPAEVQGFTRAVGELDAITTSNNAALEAWGLRREASQHREAARFEKTRTKLKVAGSLLGGVGQGLGAVADYRKTKGGGK